VRLASSAPTSSSSGSSTRPERAPRPPYGIPGSFAVVRSGLADCPGILGRFGVSSAGIDGMSRPTDADGPGLELGRSSGRGLSDRVMVALPNEDSYQASYANPRLATRR
jgi:hypothetical protein